MDLEIKWHKVPNAVNFPKTDSLIQVRNWNVKKKRRFVILDRLDKKAKSMITPRWCSDHEAKKEFLTKTKFQYKDSTHTETVKVFPVPINVGEKSNTDITCMPCKGIGVDRYNAGFFSSLDETEKLSVFLATKTYSPESHNEKVLASYVEGTFTPKKIKLDSPSKQKKNVGDANVHSRNVRVKLGVCDREIKRRTGFASERAMLSFISVLCNGDMKLISYAPSTMTWYEEWFFYFEMVWGKSLRRWEDAESDAHYALSAKQLRVIFDRKLKIALRCRESWPIYAKYKEDKVFTDKKWLNKYGNAGVVMWDDTNVDLNYMPRTAHNQRLTYSSYYGGNCAKGGVHLQFCGWLGVYDLWTGGVSDSEYLCSNEGPGGGILRRQMNFQNNDLVDGNIEEFYNLLDKGYRVIQAILRFYQKVIQPIFASMLRNFNALEGLCISEIASDRLGNERGVKCVKHSGFISNGIGKNQSYERMNDVWKVFSFQCNFMFMPVL